MTYAPAPLLAARRFLLEQFDARPGVAAAADLDPAEVGVVGDPDHRGGYHCGWNRRRLVDGALADYSFTESARDRNSRSDAASGLDIGEFSKTISGRAATLRTLSVWLVAQCAAGAPDTADIREIIYSQDGRTVRRWDRLGKRSNGDDTHLWHTHISYHRDSEHRDKTGVFRRFILEHTLGGAMTDVSTWVNPYGRVDENAFDANHYGWKLLTMQPATEIRWNGTAVGTVPNALAQTLTETLATVKALAATDTALKAMLQGLLDMVANGGDVDTAGIVANLQTLSDRVAELEQAVTAKDAELAALQARYDGRGAEVAALRERWEAVAALVGQSP